MAGSGPQEGRVPVFVFPANVAFYTDDQSTHKQVLTLYNPYEFTIRFKVLCTTPKKYNIMDSEGSIRAKCCIDIVIRHKDIGMHNEGIRDKVRIQIYDTGLKRTIAGKRDVSLVLLHTKESPEDTTFETMPSSAAAMQRGGGSEAGGRRFQPRAIPAGPSMIVVIVAVLSLFTIALPHMETTGTIAGQASWLILPQWLCITWHYKLVACFVLGMMTCAILKP